jgi:signal peptidase I
MRLFQKIYSLLPAPVGPWLVLQSENKRKKIRPVTPLERIWDLVSTVVWAITVVTIVNGLVLATFVVPTGSMRNTVLSGEFLFVNKLSLGPSTPQIIPFIDLPLPFYKLPAPFPPKQGDVMVFIYPGDRDQAKASQFQYYLKRCIAVAGDELHIRNKRTFVNGVEYGLPEKAKFILDSPYRAQDIAQSNAQLMFQGKNYTIDNFGPIRIPKKGDVLAINDSTFPHWATFIAREGHEVNKIFGTVDGKRISQYVVQRDYVFGMGDNRDNSVDSRYWGFIPEEDVVGIPMMVYWSWPVEMPGTEETRNPIPTSFFYKLSHIRWSRLFSIIQ